MLYRFISLVLTLMIATMGLADSAWASPDFFHNIRDQFELTSQRTQEFIQISTEEVVECFRETPENQLEQISCDLLKRGIKAGVVIGSCYAADNLIPKTTLSNMTINYFCSDVDVDSMQEAISP